MIALSFLGQVILAGGGASLVAWLIIKHTSSKWLDNKFAQRLDKSRHDLARDLENFKGQISASLDRKLTLQRVEFEYLTELWAEIQTLHTSVARCVSIIKQQPDLRNMTNENINSLMSELGYSSIAIEDTISSHEKNRTYATWRDRKEFCQASENFQIFFDSLNRKSIYLKSDSLKALRELEDCIWGILVDFQQYIDSQDRVSGMDFQKDAIKSFKEKLPPLLKEAERIIRIVVHEEETRAT